MVDALRFEMVCRNLSVLCATLRGAWGAWGRGGGAGRRIHRVVDPAAPPSRRMTGEEPSRRTTAEEPRSDYLAVSFRRTATWSNGASTPVMMGLSGMGKLTSISASSSVNAIGTTLTFECC